MAATHRLRTSEGVSNSPWRTRGAFDPNAAANTAHLPIADDVTISPGVAIAPYDSFIIEAEYSFAQNTIAGSSAGPLAAKAGDRLAYMGHASGPTTAAGWVLVNENYMHPPGVFIIAERYPAFSN